MDRKRLNKSVVEDADLTPNRILWDTEVLGFGLRIQNRRRVYVLKYGSGRRGVARWMTIGEHGSDWRPDAQDRPTQLTCEAARIEARRLKGMKASGQDPALLRDTTRKIPTLAAFYGRYLDEYSAHHHAERVAKEGRRSLEKDFATIGKLRIDTIGPADVTRWHVGMGESPIHANRVLARLSHIFTMARRWGVLPATHPNPCRDVQRFPETRRKRFLSSQELSRVGTAIRKAETTSVTLGGITATVAGAIRMILFTGCRIGEICAFRWDSITDGVAMQRRKARGPEAMAIMLPAPAQKLLADIPKVSDWVFPSPKDNRAPLSTRTLQDGWKRVAKLAEVPDVRPHDLRHSFASVGAQRRHSLLMIGTLLGHTQIATTQRYAHLANDPVREAADDIAGEIESALGASSPR